jgi:hypothetical protein
MKKNILLLIVSLFTVTLQAQEQNEHLKFKGVPINGTLQEYVQKMESVGFTPAGQENGFTLLQGDFAGYKNCTIGVATLKGKNLVSKITVAFPVNDVWSTLYGTYSNLKDMLTEKYGSPANSVENFQGYSQPSTDDDKIHEVKMDECKFITVFSPKQGDIELQISHDGVTSCFVILSYFDGINTNIIRKKAIDDL